MATAPIFPTPFGGAARFTSADAANTLKTLCTAGSSGAIIKQLSGSSTETAATRNMAIFLTISSVDYLLQTIQIGVNSGFTTVVPADFLTSTMTYISFDSDGNQVLLMPPSSILKVSNTTALSAGKQIDIVAAGGNF